MREDPRETWKSDFGSEYTKRNPTTVEELNAQYVDRIGISRQELNERFVGRLDRDARILEVGSNVGLQLNVLQNMGFRRLYGIDIQRDAVDRAHQERPKLDIVEGDSLDIPFRSDFFDLVFTSGVLIHIPPSELEHAIDEIVRCSKKYVFGYEYYADEHTEIKYRDHENLLWKGNFVEILGDYDTLELVKAEKFPYRDQDNTDVAYLFEIR